MGTVFNRALYSKPSSPYLFVDPPCLEAEGGGDTTGGGGGMFSCWKTLDSS